MRWGRGVADLDEFPPWSARFFAAMWLSEGWYEAWRMRGRLHYKARGIVLFDRVLCGEMVRAER